MKSYKVIVSKEKAKFFKELIENLGFEYTELDSGNVGKLQTKYGMSKEELKAKNDESLKDRQQSLQDVLRRINDMRK